MKAKVLKEFKDKYSGKLYKAGDILDVTAERFDEIQTVGNLVEEVKEKTETAKKSKKAKNTAE